MGEKKYSITVTRTDTINIRAKNEDEVKEWINKNYDRVYGFMNNKEWEYPAQHIERKIKKM